MGEINDIGGISLSLFQGIVMITLPLLLAGQTVLMFVFARYAVFNIIGRDYDAAVLSSGICGFGMGATTNAMANMQATIQCQTRLDDAEKYRPDAFFIKMQQAVWSNNKKDVKTYVLTSNYMVRLTGLEPARLGHWTLKPARLPIPP